MIDNKQAILLTGISGGMGFSIAKKFAESGYFVFGIDKNPLKEDINGVSFIKVDVTKKEEIEQAFKVVKNAGYKLKCIINAAGITDLNSLVEMSEEDFIKMFDTNVFGMYRVNKTFLPLLEERGKIIMISSELGPLNPLPFIGIYGITKSTVEKYAYSLRMELQLKGYQVVLIRPGAVDTQMIEESNRQLEKFVSETKQYSEISKQFKDIVSSVESKKIPPEKIAKLIYKVCQKKKAKYVYKINRNLGLLILNALPHRFQNWIIKKLLKPKKKKR